MTEQFSTPSAMYADHRYWKQEHGAWRNDIVRWQEESERERRAKVIHAEGEYQAATHLRDAADMLENRPMAMQMRFLQTLVQVGAENNTTIVFPVPLELASTFLAGAPSTNGKPLADTPQPELTHTGR